MKMTANTSNLRISKMLSTMNKNSIQLGRNNVASSIGDIDEFFSKNKIKKFREIQKEADAEINMNERDSLSMSIRSERRKSIVNLQEELLDTVIKYNVDRSFFIFSPDDLLKIIWDLFGMIFIIYQGVMVPYRICFDIDSVGFLAVFEIIQDFYFLTDIIISANTGYYEKGNLILVRAKIIVNYLKFWIWLDIAASFPYQLLVNPDDYFNTNGLLLKSQNTRAPQLLRLLKFMRFLRFLRLLRILKLKKILIRFEEILISDSFTIIMQFTKLLFIVLFIAHWGACFWFFIGYSEFYANGVSWLSHSDLLDKSEGDQYISSIYFYITTMTTVGYGDIIPITMLEKIYCMLSMLIACGVFAYVIGSIGTVLSSRYDEEIIFKQKIMYVDQFLIKKHINKSLRTKVRKYLEHVLEDKKDNKIDESEVLSLLNKNLKDEVIMHLNGLFLKNLTFSILHKYEEFCLLLTNIMKEETLNPSDMIFQQGDLSLRIYFINSGVVTLYDQDTKIIYQELDNKTNINFFGEIGFFGGIKRSTSAEARTFTNLTYILLDLFKESAAIFRKRNESKFKELEKDLNQIRKEIRDRDYKKLKLNCYFCDSTEHIAKDCFKMNSLDEYFRLKFKDKKHRTEQELKKIFDLRNINRQFSFKGSRKMSVISQQSFIKNTREQFFSKKDFNSFEEEVLNKDNKIEEHSHSSRSSISDINSKDPSVNSEKVINDSKYSTGSKKRNSKITNSPKERTLDG